MRKYIIFSGLLMLALSGCTMQPVAPITPVETGPIDPQTRADFITIRARMQPAIERACRQAAQNISCDFLIDIHPDPNLPPNAFQTLDDTGRPVLGFTQSLLADMHNADELAFVMGHEAAHHIAGHLTRQFNNTAAGATLFGILAAGLGGSEAAIEAAQQIGAGVGSRAYSKDFELEADHLGARLTARAGYDPVRGAAYFTRIPDPGNQFLGTHPPNGTRIATVKSAVGR